MIRTPKPTSTWARRAHSRAAIARDGECVDARRIVGLVAGELEDCGEAASQLAMVVAARPADNEARCALGVALFSLERYEDSVDALTPARGASLRVDVTLG